MVAAVQALVNGVVLAVDREHGDAVPPGRGHHQTAGHDEDFLVRERDGLAGIDGREHRLEGRRAGGRAQDEIDVRMRGDIDESGGAGTGDSRTGSLRKRGQQPLECRAVRHGHRARAVSGHLLGEALVIAASGQGDNLHLAAMCVGDGERAAADRAGAAENGDASHERSLPIVSPRLP